LVKMGEEMLKRAREFYEINRKKAEIGTAEATDLIASEANRELRKTELEVEIDKFETAVNKLRLVINYPDDRKDILPLETIDILQSRPSLIPALKHAFENRRDYERAKKEIKAKKINLSMKDNARWPQLDLEASLILNGVKRKLAKSAGNSFTNKNPEYYAKLTFSHPLENRSAKSDYIKAKNEKAKALVSLKKVEKTIVTEIDNNVRNVNLNRDKAARRLKIEDLQKTKLEEEKKQFGYGRSDSDRIIRFQEDLLQAKITALKALRDYKHSVVDLYLTKDTFLKERGLTIQ